MSKEPQNQAKGQLFLFEDIMKEYGQPAQVPASTDSDKPTEKPTAPPTLEQTQSKIIPLPKPTEQASPAPKQVPTETPPPRPRRERPEKQAKPVEEAPTLTLYAANKQTGSSGLLRSRVLGFFALISIILTIAHGLEQPMGILTSTPQTLPVVLLGLLFLSICLVLDVLKDGFFHMLSGKIRLDGLLSITIMIFVIHGFWAVDQGVLPYTAIGILGLFYGISSKGLENRCKKRIYRGMISLREKPSAILVSPHVYEETSGIHKVDGDVEDVVAPLEMECKPSQILGIYGLVAVVLSLAVAVAVNLWKGDSFLPIWASILGGSLPVYGLVVFWRPFWNGTGLLAKSGTVLCGWQGVHALGKKPRLVTTEQDLFTGNQVSVKGMKVYPEFEVRQIVGYVHTIIQADNGGLAPVFNVLFEQQNGIQYTMGEFKRYDNGGLGGEIQADVVLVGSLGFMKLMGVKMPEGANLRQAIYCSVNGQLAGVFALHYLPSAMVKNALHSYVRCGGSGLILATKDFILSPAAIRHFYKVPTGWMEFPDAQTRADLFDGNLEPGTTVGLMARVGFASMVEVSMVGQRVYSQTMIGLSLALIWGICGLILTSAVAILGAYTVSSPFNLTIFATLWAFVSWLLTTFYRK